MCMQAVRFVPNSSLLLKKKNNNNCRILDFKQCLLYYDKIGERISGTEKTQDKKRFMQIWSRELWAITASNYVDTCMCCSRIMAAHLIINVYP